MRRPWICGLLAIVMAACEAAPVATPTTGPTAASTPTATIVASTATPSATPDLASGTAGCVPADHPEWSVARRWDEALLDAIRRALPNPPVHARNLFHLSVAMWDAWAAYDPTAAGYVSTKKITASNVAQARNETISYAA